MLMRLQTKLKLMFLFVLAFFGLSFFANPSSTLAQDAPINLLGEWDDRAHIKVVGIELNTPDNLPLSDESKRVINDIGLDAFNQKIKDNFAGKLFFDKDIGDDDYSYKLSTQGCDKESEIKDQGNNNEYEIFSIHMSVPGEGCFEVFKGSANIVIPMQDGTCEPVVGSCKMVWFQIIAEDTIERVDNVDSNEDGLFVRADEAQPCTFFKASDIEDSNPDRVEQFCVIEDNTKTAGFYCRGNTCENVNIDSHQNLSKPPIGVDGVGDAASGEFAPTCETEGLSIGWMVCPVVRVAMGVFSWFYFPHSDNNNQGVINSVLNYDITGDRTDQGIADRSDEDSAYNQLEKVWSGFRIIANILFVIGFFIIIYSAASGNLLSSYDVRKLLPRLFVIAILVQLSFVLSIFALDVTNIFGEGIRSLILFPVADQSAVVIPTSVAGGDITEALGGLALGIGAIIALLALLVFSIMGMLILFVVLVMRNILLTVLIVVSPIAFAAALLPQTENYLRTWWKWFFGFLIVYPALVAFLSAGQLVASIWSAQSGNGNIVDMFITFIALFGPFYFAPKVLSFAGQAAGTLTGAMKTIQDKKDAAKGSDSYQRYKAKAAGGRAFNENSRLRRLNAPLRAVHGGRSNLTKRGRFIAENKARGMEDEAIGIAESGLSKEIASKSGDENFSEEKHLRGISSDKSASYADRMAAINRMVINNDYEGLTAAMKTMDKNEGGGAAGAAMLDRIKEKHGTTLIQKAPHLVKTKPGEAANGTSAASAIGADELVAMHGNGLQSMITQTAKEAQSSDVATRRKALAALKNIEDARAEAISRPDLSIKPGTEKVLNMYDQAIAGNPPAPGANSADKNMTEELNKI